MSIFFRPEILPEGAQILDEESLNAKIDALGEPKGTRTYFRNVAFGIPGDPDRPNVLFSNPQQREDYVAQLEGRVPRDIGLLVTLNPKWPF